MLFFTFYYYINSCQNFNMDNYSFQNVVERFKERVLDHEPILKSNYIINQLVAGLEADV